MEKARDCVNVVPGDKIMSLKGFLWIALVLLHSRHREPQHNFGLTRIYCTLYVVLKTRFTSPYPMVLFS